MTRLHRITLMLIMIVLVPDSLAPCRDLSGESRNELESLRKRIEALESGSASANEASSRLSFQGDLRLRYEETTNQDDVGSRNREVMRLRAGLEYEVNDLVTAGLRLATGDPNDPNSCDVTLGNFVDDLDVSLDRLYIACKCDGLHVAGGKFANPFLSTELVWDGSVNPQGAAASYTFPELVGVTPELVGMLSVIDEQAAASDSFMWGGQASLKLDVARDWNVRLACAYYDYSIRSLAGSDAGDIRSNNLSPGGVDYLSDFDMLDAIAVVRYDGFGDRFPVRLVGDWVRNMGAEVSGNTGYSADLYVGRASEPDDFQFRYGYSVAETDAVLAAFSHDNTTLPTNYRQHTFGIDYVLLKNTVLNVTYYLYRRDEPGTTPTTDSDRHVSRVRFNLMVRF